MLLPGLRSKASGGNLNNLPQQDVTGVSELTRHLLQRLTPGCWEKDTVHFLLRSGQMDSLAAFKIYISHCIDTYEILYCGMSVCGADLIRCNSSIAVIIIQQSAIEILIHLFSLFSFVHEKPASKGRMVLPDVILITAVLSASVVVPGVALLLLWKLLTSIHGRRESAHFQGELRRRCWNKVSPAETKPFCQRLSIKV